MTKKIILLLCVMTVFFSGAVLARSHQETADWVAIKLGNGNDNVYFFNVNSLHYDVDENGKIHKNVIVYEEKKINRNTATLSEGFYSITQCKINLTDKSLMLGEETFYKKDGEKRWSEKPLYLVWYVVKPGTIGETRYNAVADYVKNNPEKVK
ncbi:hypothetical protein [Pectinatus sottacetonis]|uniref:hypothetical protein n=1 Tax=Pectinatus sottacetonis TaxID=1002795 RepID=UPI0018C49117|nr:hypothetical protein [Pectinatus sottacetonis]